MAWPPSAIAADKANATVAEDDHAQHHNALAGAINDLVAFDPGRKMWFNVKDYGAVGDGTTNDAPAINLAKDALIAMGGGVLYFPASAEPYLINGGVNFEGAGPMALVGDGPSASRIKVRVDGATAFRIWGTARAEVRGLRFVGGTEQGIDCNQVIRSSGSLRIQWCEFIGILTPGTTGNATVRAQSGHLEMNDVQFGACGHATGTATGVVLAEDSRGVIVRNVLFTDYGTQEGFGTGKGACERWFWIGPTATALVNAWSQGVIDIQTLRCDESARQQLVIEGGANQFEWVRLSGVTNNIGFGSTDKSIQVNNVKRLVMENCFIGYQSAMSSRVGLELSNITKAELSHVTGVLGGGRANIAATVAYLSAADCSFTEFNNDAVVSDVFTGRPPYGGGGLVAVPDDLDATGTPSGSTYLRGDGAWATPAGGGDLLAANNLSDLASIPTARDNLGLDALAQKETIAVPGDITATGTASGTTFLRGDGAWAEPAGGDAPSPVRWTTGYYYLPSGRFGTQAAALSRVFLTPLWIPRGASVDRIGCEVTSGAVDALVRLGIYTADAGGLPGSLVFDAGTADASASGFPEITLSPAEELPDDVMVWLALATAGAGATYRGIQDRHIGMGARNTTLSASLGANASSGYFLIVDASAGLPSTVTAALNTASIAPVAVVRAASTG